MWSTSTQQAATSSPSKNSKARLHPCHGSHHSLHHYPVEYLDEYSYSDAQQIDLFEQRASLPTHQSRAHPPPASPIPQPRAVVRSRPPGRGRRPLGAGRLRCSVMADVIGPRRSQDRDAGRPSDAPSSQSMQAIFGSPTPRVSLAVSRVLFVARLPSPPPRLPRPADWGDWGGQGGMGASGARSRIRAGTGA